MDPITAIGFAANILSFIDYSASVIRTTIDIYESTSGSTQDGQNSDTVATEMMKFAAKLQHPVNIFFLSGEERALCKLATECEGLAKKILKLLDTVKCKNPKSKGSSLVAGVKNKMYEGERRKLEEHLNYCRGQLNLQLTFLTSSKTQARLDALVDSVKNDSSGLQSLHNQVDNLSRGVTVGSLTPAAQAQLRLLLGMQEHILEVISQKRFLQSLAFDGMHRRYETVDDAHFKTLRWIFDEPLGSATFHESEEKTSAKRLLLKWLSSGSGIFHICGKLGSGKSTLMKYLCDHAKTKSLLKQWAGHRQLALASFFFWKPGSIMQKSLAGLIRSLLHDILETCPDLIKDIYPDHWHQIKSTPWQVQFKLPLSDKSVRKAFSLLTSDPRLYTNHCFCFFIDGLDEYEGTYQEDCRTLVDLLSTWTKLAPTTVKICVSSREYNVFMNAFSKTQRIQLHALNRSDMTRYCLDKLQHMDREGDKLKLADAIGENAQGIFVWVALVVRRIREQIENGANFETLQQEINSLPKELEDLFEHILNSLADSDLKKAYQTLSMVMELNQYGGLCLTLLSYSFLDEFTKDPEFASRKDFRRDRLLFRGARIMRNMSALKQLNGYCKGLLGTGHDPRDVGGDVSRTIICTHRSIFEFLSTRTQVDRIKSSLDGFNTIAAISQLTLAEFWSREPGDIIKDSLFETLTLALVPLRAKDDLDKAPYSFMRSLSLAWERHQEEEQYDWDGEELRVVGQVPPMRSNLVDLVWRPAATVQEDVYRKPQLLRHPIYSAAMCGNYGYVLRHLEDGISATALFTPLRLLYCVLSNRERVAEQSLRDLMDCLHTRHDLHPETDSSLFWTYWYPAMLESEHKTAYHTLGFGDMNTGVPLWHHILLRCYNTEVQNLFQPIPTHSNRMRGLGYIVEKLLEYGADPYFYISVTNSPNLRMKIIVRVRGELRKHWLVRSSNDQDPNAKLLSRQAPYECENLSLIDLVERWDFENKMRILELVKKNLLLLDIANDQAKGLDFPEKEETREDAKAFPSETNPYHSMILADSGPSRDSLTEISEFGTRKPLDFTFAISLGILVFGVAFALVIQHNRSGNQ